MVVGGPHSVSAADLEGIVGRQHIRPGEGKDDVDGLLPTWVVEPGTVEEAAAVLCLANEACCPVVPRGGGTKIGLGNIPAGVGLILSTARLNRLLEHAAGDLVATAEAGALLHEVQTRLRRAGQWLALDPAEPAGTIGGVVAANASGPHRLRFGTVRDQLIGFTYILPDGTVAKAGGKVVKNVAGYDLGKLFTGSLGTLGLIAQATFRLHPLPARSCTVFLSRRERSPENLSDAVQSVLHSTLTPVAMDFHWGRNGIRLMVRFEGIEAGVAAQVEEAAGLLRLFGEVESSAGDERFWQNESALTNGHFERASVIKLAAVPGDLPRIISALEALRGEAHAVRIWGHAGTGVTYADIVGKPAAQLAAIVGLRDAVRSVGGSVVVQRAPVEVKGSLDVWGDAGDALPLMRTVKALFDPNGIMNPGRYIGRL